MPRKYTPLNKHKKHTEEDINKALQLIKDGMSLRVAADCSGIHYSVLYRHMKKGGEIKKKGGQTALSTEEEKILVDRIMICSEWGYPIGSVTLRLLVKEYLDRSGRKVKKFKDNLPGKDFVYSFLESYKSCLSFRMCQNIKRSRAGITPEVINEYFANLEKELKDVPRSNIVNYDETNLCDDPGKKKVITRRGCKYPERVMNSTKASTSVMFAAAGDGNILPPYVVYKAQHLYDSWREGGPANSHYNRTKSGWFDSFCFTDWVETVALPYFRRLDGVKFLIGNNLSSHLSVEVMKKCNKSNVKFIFLPSNSTHLTQPLDVAFFRPLKMDWRAVLGDWKNGPGKYEATVPKDKFPSLLKKVFDSCKAENVVAGFKKCGIIPVDRQKVLDMLPGSTGNTTSTITGMPTVKIDDCLKHLLQQMREGDTPQPRKRRVRVSVAAGKSVEVKDFEDEHVDVPTHEKKTKSTTKKTDHSSSSSSSSSSISDLDSETRSEEEESDKEPPNPELKFLPGEFAVSKVFGKTKDKFRMYVCKIVDYEEGGYVCQFYKKVPLVKKFTATDEESFVSKEDVIKKLNSPVAAVSSSRFKDTINFDDDLTGLPIY